MSMSPVVADFFPPKPSLVSAGIQFSCGRFSSRVSSMLTIFIWGGMNRRTALSVVVLPLAVPPQTSMELPYSVAIHRYAIISVLIVLNLSRSTGVNGFSLNRLMVNDEPRLVTCLPSVAFSLEPSGIVASSNGSATEMCLPHFCASQTTKESRSAPSRT